MATILTVKAVVDGYDKRANCTVFSTQSGVGVLSPLADEGNENQPDWVNKANAKLTKPVITAGEGPEERSNTFVAKAIDGYAGFVGRTTEGFAAMADLGLDFVKLEHKNVDAAFGMRWDTGIKLDKKEGARFAILGFGAEAILKDTEEIKAGKQVKDMGPSDFGGVGLSLGALKFKVQWAPRSSEQPAEEATAALISEAPAAAPVETK